MTRIWLLTLICFSPFLSAQGFLEVESGRSEVARSGVDSPRPARRSFLEEVSAKSYLDPQRSAPVAAPRTPRLRTTAKNRASQVWPVFERNFAICAPGCEPVGAMVHRHPQAGRRSCHYSGRAVDVFGIQCGRSKSMAISGSAKFGRFVNCMKRRMKTLYQNGDPQSEGVTESHYDHAHFSLGCYNGTFR